jgi:hypothetical protein
METPQYWIKNILWRYPKTISNEKVIFVLGTPRSGTTLLQKIMEAHSQTFSIDSETGLFSYRNFFGKKRNPFKLPDEVKQDLLSKSKDIIDYFDNVLNFYKKTNSDKIFIEKTPQHILKLTSLLKYFPNAYFIHIVRDGRDCYCSAKQHPYIPQSSSIIKFSKFIVNV